MITNPNDFTNAAYMFAESERSTNLTGLSVNQLMGFCYLRHIYQQVHYGGFSYLGSFDGRHRSGKSITAFYWAWLLDKTFSQDPESRVIRTNEEFIKQIDKLERNRTVGAAFIIDEAGTSTSSMDWYERMVKTVVKLNMAMGYLRPVVFFCAPVMQFVDARLRKMFHAYYNVKRPMKRTDYARVYCYDVKFSAIYNKSFFKRPSIRVLNEDITLDFLKVGLPPRHIVDCYERIAELEKKEIIRDIIQDVEQSKEKTVRQKKDLDSVIKAVIDNSKYYEAKRSRPGRITLNEVRIGYKFDLSVRESQLVKQEAEEILTKKRGEQNENIQENEKNE